MTKFSFLGGKDRKKKIGWRADDNIFSRRDASSSSERLYMDNEIRVCTMLYDFVRVALDKTWSVISIWSRYYRRNSTSGSKHSRLSVLTRGESVRSGLIRSVGSSIDSFGLVFPLLVPWWKIVEFLSRRVGPRYFFRIPYQSWFAYSTDVGKIGHRFEPSKRIGSVFHSTRPDRREINRKVGRRG